MDVRGWTAAGLLTVAGAVFGILADYRYRDLRGEMLPVPGMQPLDDVMFVALIPAIAMVCVGVTLLHRETHIPGFFWVGASMLGAAAIAGVVSVFATSGRFLFVAMAWQAVMVAALAAFALGLEQGGQIGRAGPRMLLVAVGAGLLGLLGQAAQIVSLHGGAPGTAVGVKWLWDVVFLLIAAGAAAMAFHLLRGQGRALRAAAPG